MGVRYERKGHEHFLERYPDTYVPGPWFEFDDASGRRWCQPDGLLIDIKCGRVTIVEFKYQHTLNAWWQIWSLYAPVLQHVFPGWDIRGVEVVKWYDAAVFFPNARLTEDPSRAPQPPATGVYIFRA